MKKFYIQPETDLMLSAPQSIVCTSPQFGDKKDGTSDTPVWGNAPARKITTLYI